MVLYDSLERMKDNAQIVHWIIRHFSRSAWLWWVDSILNPVPKSNATDDVRRKQATHFTSLFASFT